MTAVPLPLTQIDRSGGTPAGEVNGDATNGHTVVNDGNVEVIVRNSGASTHNVTFHFAHTVDGVIVPGKAAAVAAGVTKKFYGFPPILYGALLSITVDNAELKLSAEHKVGV